MEVNCFCSFCIFVSSLVFSPFSKLFVSYFGSNLFGSPFVRFLFSSIKYIRLIFFLYIPIFLDQLQPVYLLG